MTESELLEIEERAKAATPGPWESFEQNQESSCDGERLFRCGVWAKLNQHPTVCKTPVFSDDDGNCQHANSDFIAAAREDVPALIAEIRRLRGICIELIVAADKHVPINEFPDSADYARRGWRD